VKLGLYMLLGCILSACTLNSDKNAHEEDAWMDDELKARIAESYRIADSLYEEQAVRFHAYMGLLEMDGTSACDTLITFWHDFSFAAMAGGKVCQILKTDSTIVLREVFYSNRLDQTPKDSGFTLMSFHTGEIGTTLYSFNFFQQTIKLSKWNDLIRTFKREYYFSLKPIGNEAVIDGSHTSIKFEYQGGKYSVSRRWLDNDSFFRLCKMIDSWTKYPLDDFARAPVD
jgi:hypothetical protein